ncbi:MAG: metallophosphoesterase [Myxococcales bacterium]|nr:metallophosphoesterase [Myxococcales bacterium]
MKSASPQHNYLIFSDVHLGADLVQHVRPWTVARLKQVARVDRDLCAMLDWYRERADPKHPWRLVIAGDLVDFIGMSIAPSPDTAPSLNDEERVFGLGSSRDHAAIKMRAVAARHRPVFERLAAFLHDGHSIALVRGNHDVDFYWDEAQEAFREAILDHLPPHCPSEERADSVTRIRFFPWFYYEEGLLYVEHGHQFDAMCAYHHPLKPLSPLDPRRIGWSFADLLFRRVVRPTPGLGSEGHEHRSFVSYVRLALSLGLGGAFRLFVRYVSTTLLALRTWRSHLGARARALREDHDLQFAVIAARSKVGIDRLQALAALWRRPVTTGGWSVLRSMFMDRLLLLATVAILVPLLGVLIPIQFWLWVSGALLAVVLAYQGWSRRERKRDLDPAIHMHLAAHHIGRILDARYVLMGHTHTAMASRVGDCTTYVNLGNWGTDEVDEDHDEPTRTHFVVRWELDRPRATFLRWDPKAGSPRPGPTLPPEPGDIATKRM